MTNNSANSIGRWRRKTPFFGAMAMMGAKSSASVLVAAFQSPFSRQSQRIPSRALPFLHSSNLHSRRHPRSAERIWRGVGLSSAPLFSSLSSQKATPSTSTTAASSATGWINSDTLNLQETIHSSSVDATSVKFDDDETTDTKIKYPSPSPIERLLIRDRLVYVKRDDVLHLPSSNISGNKARKFLSLNNIPATEFPDAIVSYGGPQSNAMVALAAIVSSKNAELEGTKSLGRDSEDWISSSFEGEGKDMFWQLDVSENENGVGNGKGANRDKTSSSRKKSSFSTETTGAPKKRFIYYTKTMPRYLRKNPNGNLLRSLALGMELRTVSHDEYNQLFGGLNGGSVMAPADLDPPVPGGSLWIPQGGACSVAQIGSDVLAEEIVDYWSGNGKGMPLAVCVPGGTCTTALLLHRSLNRLMEQRRSEKKNEPPLDIRLVVIPCVGDDEYAMRQMMSLDRSVGGRGRREDMPAVLKPRSDIEYGSARRRAKGYFTFGEPAKAILQTYDEMNENGLFLDLLYGAPAWSLVLQHWKSRDSDCPIANRQVMYVHSGGLEGIASQLTRYKHKGLIDSRKIQIG